MLLRIVVSAVSGLAGSAAAFGLVTLLFYLIRVDPGIGGGLLALAAALIALPAISCLVYLRMSRKKPGGGDPGRPGGP